MPLFLYLGLEPRTCSCSTSVTEMCEIEAEVVPKKIKLNEKMLITETGRNMMSLENTAEVVKRYNVSSRAAAGIVSAWLADAGLISETDKRLAVDHKKVNCI